MILFSIFWISITFTFKIKYLFKINTVKINIKKYKRLPCQVFIRSNLLKIKSFFSFLEVSPSLVAGGIKIALLTTVGGLIVAVILQLFYNYLVSKIDSLVNTMEDASISLVDILVKNKLSK